MAELAANEATRLSWNPRHPGVAPNDAMQESHWDTIILAAGSAGCALAARLSADPERRVLLLEAGPSDRHLIRRVPAGHLGTVGDPRFD